MKTVQIQSDLFVVHQATSLGLEIRSELELAPILKALQDDEVVVVMLHDRRRRIELSLYLRFRQ